MINIHFTAAPLLIFRTTEVDEEHEEDVEGSEDVGSL